MAVTLYNTATEYTSNAITLTRGTAADIVSVGVYHNANPSTVPTIANFIVCVFANGTTNPPDPLAVAGELDVVALIGTKSGAHLALAAGTWQRWILVRTAAEDIIRKVDTVTVL